MYMLKNIETLPHFYNLKKGLKNQNIFLSNYNDYSFFHSNIIFGIQH